MIAGGGEVGGFIKTPSPQPSVVSHFAKVVKRGAGLRGQSKEGRVRRNNQRLHFAVVQRQLRNSESIIAIISGCIARRVGGFGNAPGNALGCGEFLLRSEEHTS